MSQESLLAIEVPADRPAKEGVTGRTGLAVSTIYAEIKATRFTKPVKTGRSSRWIESEINVWIAARITERDKS
jgi:predicted DNA-binding transcriptional regulator AlpA